MESTEPGGVSSDTGTRRVVQRLRSLDRSVVKSLVPRYQGPTQDWLRRRGSGVILERSVTSPSGVLYMLAIRRRCVPTDIGGGIGPLLFVGGLVAFTVARALHRGYQVEVSRQSRRQPGFWRRLRPLPQEQTVVVGPFRTMSASVVEADAVAVLLARGDYPDAP